MAFMGLLYAKVYRDRGIILSDVILRISIHMKPHMYSLSHTIIILDSCQGFPSRSAITQLYQRHNFAE